MVRIRFDPSILSTWDMFGQGTGIVGVNQNVKLDNHTFVAVSVVGSTFAADVTEQTTSSDFAITDDIILKPPAFRITLKLIDRWSTTERDTIDDTRIQQYYFLLALWKFKRVFKFESDLGVYNTVIIESLEVSESEESSSTFDVELSLRVIYIARILPALFQFITDADGTI